MTNYFKTQFSTILVIEPLRTRSRSSRKVVPSKGREPLTRVYKITPRDQTEIKKKMTTCNFPIKTDKKRLGVRKKT